MEYILILGGMGQNLGARMKMGLQAAYDKMFENPMILAVVVGAVILLGLWGLKSSR